MELTTLWGQVKADFSMNRAESDAGCLNRSDFSVTNWLNGFVAGA